MGDRFAGSEIVELGVQIEKNGRDFYNFLAGQSKHEKARNIFAYLAKEEEKHIASFRELLDAVRNEKPPGSYPDEYFAYMNILAGDYVFTRQNKGKEVAKRAKNEKDALNLALGFEKDSILFFEGMKDIVPEYDRKIIRELINQEKEHLRKLYDLKEVIPLRNKLENSP